jgi:hypothetical protein
VDFVKPHLERLPTSREWPKTICPSKAARAPSSDKVTQCGATAWRDLMPAATYLTSDIRIKLRSCREAKSFPQSQTLENTTGPIRLRKKKAVIQHDIFEAYKVKAERLDETRTCTIPTQTQTMLQETRGDTRRLNLRTWPLSAAR